MLRRLLRLLPLKTLRGYEHPELVETIFRKTVAYDPAEPWPEMDGVGSVLDFGGGCGLHYKQAANSARWAVVETPAMVARAKELETDRLRFFTDIDAASAWLGTVEVMHSNGALQYASDPEGPLRKLCALRARTLLWYRLFLGDPHQELQASRLIDNGPGRAPVRIRNKQVHYARTAIPLATFLAAHEGYDLQESGNDWFRFTLSHSPR